MYKSLTLSVLFIFGVFVTNAQRLEIHGIKDLSNNSIVNKAWGVGGAVHLDQWVKKTTFSVHFDWTTYRPKNKKSNPRFDRMSGGVSAFYSFNISEKISIQCGADANYTNLKYSYLFSYEDISPEKERPVTLQHTGHFIGVGPLVGFNYKLSPRFGVRVTIVPTYLISVKSKTTLPDVTPEYSKNLWLFPIQFGITYRIFNSEK